ncbi:MAG TPA: cytochrome c3 family protein [Phycisphaerae bacterium]|nr:cytochrome c3 family protein [Phycisphaerae bacterium]
MKPPSRSTSKQWMWRGVCVGLVCTVLMVACSEQQRQRFLVTFFDGVPQGDAATEGGEQPGVDAVPADRRTAAGPTAEEETGTFRDISANHADFATDCQACHGPGVIVTGVQCRECHDAGLHRGEEVDVTCGRCHVEHRGLDADLTRVPADRCAACHDRQPFEKEHAEFGLIENAEAARKAKYAAGLEVFHSVHTEDSECSECHQPSGRPEVAFKPVTFADSCATCHELDEHKAVPETPWAELREKLPEGDGADAVLLAEARWQQQRAALKDRPEWAAIEEVREALIDDGLEECFRCHSFVEKEVEGKRTLAAAPVRYRSRWYTSARFSHGTHAEMDCDGCHTVAEDTDAELGRLMLPGKEVCAECHNADGVSNACSTCHVFHGE